MRKLLAAMLIMIMLMGLWPSGTPVSAATLNAGSKAEMISIIREQIEQRSESFSIHYRGSQDLTNDNFISRIVEYNGSEYNTMLQSVYGFQNMEWHLRYVKGTDIQYTFDVAYDYSKSEEARLDADLQTWVNSNLSPDMYSPVKAAIISRYLSERLLYLLNAEQNNAYDGYYIKSTACSGYAQLSFRLLEKAGLPVKVISGYIPKGVSDTEYLAMRLTNADMLSLSDRGVEQVLNTLHVWNMVQIAGNWYHLDTTWLDGDQNGAADDGRLHPEFFLGSDGDFGRSHAWVRSEYPEAAANWWDAGSGELENFLKAYLKTDIYDYPYVNSLERLNAFTEDAYRSGRGSQTFRITQGVQPSNMFPTLGSALGKVSQSHAEYREIPRYPGDSYLLTLDFEGRDPGAKESVPPMVPAVKVTRGDLINPVELLADPERSDRPPVQWISLSPALLNVSGGNFTALKEGRAYIGAYTRDEAVIIPVTIEIPPLRVVLNGSVLALNPSPIILNGRTLVPMRGIFEAMGAAVAYDPEKRTITGTRGGNTLLLTLGSRVALINGQATPMDVTPQIINDRAFVPARLIAESFGATVQWDGAGNRVMITDTDN